jgi:electron transport complex protein RnfC
MNAMTNLTKALKMTKDIFHFHGGVHPPGRKLESTQLPIGQLALPEKLVLPLRQHVGNIPKIKVAIGDHVLKGQLIAEAEGTISAAIHAPTSGVISAIEDATIPHPSGLPDRCIIITPDGKDTWITLKPQDWRNADRQDLVGSIRLSGVVGLGGATFPTHIKLRANGKSDVHTLIINAAECEPYITCDDMLMRERSDQIVKGIEIAQYLLDADTIIIGIENNKRESITAMQAATADKNIQVKIVPTLYPSGDARRLVHLVLGQEIPHDKRSTQVGIQVFNVATVLALYRHFEFGEPSINRIVSMTGNVASPQNFEVLFGTPLTHLVKAAGDTKPNTSHFIMGGPMMGFQLPSEDVPITKAANCIIAASPAQFEDPAPAMPCIRCARCADACPVSLQPQELYWFTKSDNFEKAHDYNLFDCIECGACSYVCPSNIPLVQYYRYGKSEIIAADKAQEAADIARERNEFRLARIEREKQERAQKHAARTQGTKTTAGKIPANAKQAAIAAAVARAKAQKEAAAIEGAAPLNIKPTNKHVKAKIAEIDARRASTNLTTAKTEQKPAIDQAKQDKINAAIARAKAKKAAAEAAKNDIENE